MTGLVPIGSDGVAVAETSEAGRELHEELARRFGTPLYVYDAEALAARVAELQNVLPVNRMLYSFKANPLPSVASELRRNGCQADLTSPGEITAAREEGFDLSLALSSGL